MDSKGYVHHTPTSRDHTAELPSEMYIFDALKRRALAADVAGVCAYESMNAWHELLRQTLKRRTLPGYGSVTLNQLRLADQELWIQIAQSCQDGCGCVPGGRVTKFEMALLRAMDSINVRMLLQPHMRGTGSAASSSRDHIETGSKLEGQLRNLKSQHENLKRKLGQLSQGNTNKAQDNSKNKRSKGAGHGKKFTDVSNMALRTPAGEEKCRNYNTERGCTLAPPGARCQRGWHLCFRPGCSATHSATEHRDQ